MNELLEEAKRKFPMGTEFSNVNLSGATLTPFKDNGIVKTIPIRNNKGIMVEDHKGRTRYIYCDNIWADIISLSKNHSNNPEYEVY